MSDAPDRQLLDRLVREHMADLMRLAGGLSMVSKDAPADGKEQKQLDLIVQVNIAEQSKVKTAAGVSGKQHANHLPESAATVAHKLPSPRH